METVIVAKDENGGLCVHFQTDGVLVLIVDKDELYTYGDLACNITGLNDDGTVNVKVLYSLIGEQHSRYIDNVPAGELFPYFDEDDDPDDDPDLNVELE